MSAIYNNTALLKLWIGPDSILNDEYAKADLSRKNFLDKIITPKIKDYVLRAKIGDISEDEFFTFLTDCVLQKSFKSIAPFLYKNQYPEPTNFRRTRERKVKVSKGI